MTTPLNALAYAASLLLWAGIIILWVQPWLP